MYKNEAKLQLLFFARYARKKRILMPIPAKMVYFWLIYVCVFEKKAVILQRELNNTCFVIANRTTL